MTTASTHDGANVAAALIAALCIVTAWFGGPREAEDAVEKVHAATRNDRDDRGGRNHDPSLVISL